MKTLLTGPDGQIGAEILSAWPRERGFGRQPCEIIPLSIEQCDFTNVAALRRFVREIKPNLIINASGYTAVDRAESEPDLARAINATAVGVLGEEARRLGAAVVHFSTDYVFDGRKRTPYTPEDKPNPQGVYAQSKREGEVALIESGAPYIIIRTAWIYGLRGRNFLLAILRQAAQKPELKIVNDQTGCPTWSRSVARGTIEMVSHAMEEKTGSCSFGGREGVYHLCAGGSTTWFDFARRIFQLADIPRTAPWRRGRRIQSLIARERRRPSESPSRIGARIWKSC
jgi:dTDP-4-dehydrorhamnose reductase